MIRILGNRTVEFIVGSSLRYYAGSLTDDRIENCTGNHIGS